MLNTFRNMAAAAAMVILGGALLAQPPDWYAHRYERFQGNRWRAHLFAEVREDLNHVQATTFRGHDQYRIARTKEELGELQSDLDSDRYEDAKLDDVVGALQKVVADNRMSGRDRDVLNDDLRRLKNYREHHESWRRLGNGLPVPIVMHTLDRRAPRA